MVAQWSDHKWPGVNVMRPGEAAPPPPAALALIQENERRRRSYEWMMSVHRANGKHGLNNATTWRLRSSHRQQFNM